jgi:alpha-tubulin suppressor-like RCC1 family protein
VTARLALVVAATLLACLALSPAAGADVVRWGSESNNEAQTSPLEVEELPEPPMVIDAGNRTGYALEPNGTEFAWGSAGHGEFGNGKGEHSRNFAEQVDFPAGVRIVAIGEARASGFAVDSTGQGWAWGEGAGGMFCGGHKNTVLPIEVPGVTDAVAVQGGETHVLWLLANGTVVGCGTNEFGELGLGRANPEADMPMPVPGVSDAVEISAGERHSLVRTASGQVFAFGSNEMGQVCQPAGVKKLFKPTVIPLPGPASEVSGGGNHPWNGHSFFMVEGVPYGCGDDSSGQIGDGHTATKFSPAVATDLLSLGLTEVVAAGETSLGLSSSGEVYAWGNGEDGDLANGSEEGFSLMPLAVQSGALQVSATAENMLARTG